MDSDLLIRKLCSAAALCRLLPLSLSLSSTALQEQLQTSHTETEALKETAAAKLQHFKQHASTRFAAVQEELEDLRTQNAALQKKLGEESGPSAAAAAAAAAAVETELR